jgi:hypothetical protein
MIGIDLRANFYRLCTYVLLILAAAGAGATWWFYDSAQDAKAKLDVAEAQRDKAKYIATQVISFNAGYQKVADVLRGQLYACQRGARKMKDDNDNAVKRWMAEAKDADAALKKFVGQFDAKPQSCGAALAELDRVCESLAGY